jgi:ubiquinol-cytochrome c reductase cytochrome b/c1 subunit
VSLRERPSFLPSYRGIVREWGALLAALVYAYTTPPPVRTVDYCAAIGHREGSMAQAIDSSASSLVWCIPIPKPYTWMSSRSYSTHLLLTPAYSLGFSALYLVAIQVVTGLLLAANYQASDTASWTCIRTLARELSVGYLTLSIHANSAALLFLVIYLHMGRALFRSSTTSKPRVWLSGVIIYVLLIGTCFTGYSLVYGQMSMWAIVVICSLVTATPVIGPDLLTLVWGGSSVSTATIGRLFTVHYLLGLVVVALAVLHMTVLHNVGSSGSRDLVSNLPRSDRIDFLHAYLVRDVTIALIATATVGAIASWYPSVMGEADNFIPASPLITPACICPEWYMMPYYGLVRAIPSKIVGIAAMGIAFTTIANVGDSGYRSQSASLVFPQSTLFLFILDVVALCKVCLLVNQGETIYILLVGSVTCIATGTLVSSDTSITALTSVSPHARTASTTVVSRFATSTLRRLDSSTARLVSTRSLLPASSLARLVHVASHRLP